MSATSITRIVGALISLGDTARLSLGLSPR